MKKLKIKGIIQLLLVFNIILLAGCSSTQKTTKAPLANKTIQILSVNDMHANIDNFPRFAFIVDSLRDIYPNLILLSAGDNQTGNPVNDQYKPKGLPIITLMNDTKFDISAIGNHEFDLGQDLINIINENSNFNYLCSNINLPKDKKIKIKPYIFYTLPNNIKLCFVSLLDLNTAKIPDTHPDNIKNFTFENPKETAKKLLKLKDSCDLLIFLNHYGFENDVELAKILPNDKVKLIIGAHTHTKVEDNFFVNNIMITQAANKLKFATLINIDLTHKENPILSSKLLTVGNKGKENSEIRKKLDKFNENPFLNEKIANNQSNIKTYEEVGYLMSDAIRYETKSDIGLVNLGGVRIEKIDAGPVTVKTVYSMDPFGNELIIYNLTGHELKDLHITAFPLDEYGYVIPSGLHSKYIFDSNGKIIDVELFDVNNQPLDLDKNYSVVMNNYMASTIPFKHKDVGKNLFRPSAETTINYLRNIKEINYSNSEKRITTNKN